MREVVLVDGARTAFGKMGGSLRKIASSDLGAFVCKGIAEKVDLFNRAKLDGVFVGSAFVDCQTNTIGRYITQKAEFPLDVSGTYVEMQCGSAITAMNLAAAKIATGMADVLLVGGVESHSTRVAKFSMSAEPYKLQPPTAIPNILAVDKSMNTPMLANSDLMAKTWSISMVDYLTAINDSTTLKTLNDVIDFAEKAGRSKYPLAKRVFFDAYSEFDYADAQRVVNDYRYKQTLTEAARMALENSVAPMNSTNSDEKKEPNVSVDNAVEDDVLSKAA